MIKAIARIIIHHAASYALDDRREPVHVVHQANVLARAKDTGGVDERRDLYGCRVKWWASRGRVIGGW